LCSSIVNLFCFGLHLFPFGYHCGFLFFCNIKWHIFISPLPFPYFVFLCKFVVCVWCITFILVISSWKLFILCFCYFFYNTCKRAFDNCVLLLCIAFVLVFMVFFCFALRGGIFLLFPLVFFFVFFVGLWCMCGVRVTTLLSFSSDQ